jgi:hypothetical protein
MLRNAPAVPGCIFGPGMHGKNRKIKTIPVSILEAIEGKLTKMSHLISMSGKVKFAQLVF